MAGITANLPEYLDQHPELSDIDVAIIVDGGASGSQPESTSRQPAAAAGGARKRARGNA